MAKILMNIRMPKEMLEEFDNNVKKDDLFVSRTSAIIRLVHEYNEKKKREKGKK